MRREESLSTLNEKVIEQNKELFTEMSKKILFNEKYQKILFFLFSLATYGCILTLTNYPSQKNLPDFVCLSNDRHQIILNIHGLDLNTEIDFQPKNIKNKIYDSYANLFSSSINNHEKIKIIKNEICVNQYCNNNKDELKIIKESESLGGNTGFPGILIANYESINNYVTQYDSMCDYENFFGFLSTIINFGRILGSLYFSTLSDRSGRLIAFKYNVYLMLISYTTIFIFSSSRIFIYLFMFMSSLSNYLYFLIITIASETMNQTYFSLFNSAMSAIFSLSGIVSLITMIFIKNVYFLYFLQLIIIIILFYFSKEYVLETFGFLIKNNLFEESLKNMNYLNKLMNMRIEEDPINKEKLEKLERFVHIYATQKLNITDYDVENKENLYKNQEHKRTSIKKKIELLEIDDFYNDKKAHLISDKSYKKNLSLKHTYNAEDLHHVNKSEILQKFLRNDSFETLAKSNEEKKHNEHFNRNKNEKITKLTEHQFNLKSAEHKSIYTILKEKIDFQIKNMLGPYMDIFLNEKYFWMFVKFLPIYIAVNIIYFGQIFNVEKLSGDVYGATFIIFTAELTGEVIAAMIVYNSERKKVLYFCLFTNGSLYSIAIFTENVYVRYFVTFGGSISITIAFIALYIFAAETFDIEVKNSLTSLLTNSSCVFMIFFPYIVELFPNIFVIFSLVCFLSMNMTRYFEETYKGEQ